MLFIHPIRFPSPYHVKKFTPRPAIKEEGGCGHGQRRQSALYRPWSRHSGKRGVHKRQSQRHHNQPRHKRKTRHSSLPLSWPHLRCVFIHLLFNELSVIWLIYSKPVSFRQDLLHCIQPSLTKKRDKTLYRSPEASAST